MSGMTRVRRVATVLVSFACVMAGAWLVAFIVTGQDHGGFRILAVLPAAVGITLFRMFPRETSVEPKDVAGTSPERGATHPAPVDIVDR